MPIFGTASADPIQIGDPVTLQDTAVAVSVAQSLIGAGVSTGLVQFANSLEEIGTPQPGNPVEPVDGQNAVTGNVHLKITGSNTAEGEQTASGPASITFYVWVDGVSGAVHVMRGTPDPGNNATALTEVTSVDALVDLADTVWTSTGGEIKLAEKLSQPSNLVDATPADKAAAPLIIDIKINGLVNAPFNCWPGSSHALVPPPGGTGSQAVMDPAASVNAIDTVTVNAPPTAPVCANETVSVGAGQPVTIDLTDNCTDVNGNGTIDLGSLNLSAVSEGTLTTTATPGVYEYAAPAVAPLAPVTFTYTVADTTPLTSESKTVTINVLGNLCDATAAPCDLTQVITVPVIGATRVLEQAGSSITMVSAASIVGPDGLPGTPDDTPALAAPLVLNGQPQMAVGRLNQMTVTNARGDDAGWDVTGSVTPFYDVLKWNDPTTQTFPACVAAAPASSDNHCIPGDNLGWSPSSAVAHVQVLGDAAVVTNGTTLLPPGFFAVPPTTPTGLTTPGLPAASAKKLCSSPANHSGGTFTCDAGLALSVPASTAEGVYVATLTLTLA